MRILQFCHKSPFPPKEGGPIAMNNITKGLTDAGHTVKVFAISTPKTDMRQLDMRHEINRYETKRYETNRYET